MHVSNWFTTILLSFNTIFSCQSGLYLESKFDLYIIVLFVIVNGIVSVTIHAVIFMSANAADSRNNKNKTYILLSFSFFC